MKEQNEFKLLRAVGGIGDDILEEAASANVRRRRSKTIIALVATLAVLAALFLTTVAAAYDIGFYMSRIFGGDVEMLDEMTAKPGHVFKTGSSDVKFDVVGITGDRYNAYIWLDVTVPEGLDSDGKTLAFRGTHSRKIGGMFAVDGHSLSNGLLTKKSENVYSTFCSITSSNSLVGQRITLIFEDLCALPEGVIVNPKFYEPVADGSWTLTFSLNYPDLTREFAPDIGGQIVEYPEQSNLPNEKLNPAKTLTIDECRVLLSPMSITLEFDAKLSPPYNTISGIDELTLVFKDGSEIVVRIGHGGSTYSGKEGLLKFYCGNVFEEPIDPDSVSAVRYGNILIPLE